MPPEPTHVQASGPPGPGAERLERLQQQHEADSEAVEAIRRELERALVRRASARAGWVART